MMDKYKLKKNKLFKKKINLYTKKYIKNIKFSNQISYKNINLLVRKKYYKDRVILFGDALHVVHPIVGQGFNMTLRDLENLSEILNKKLSLGLDIGNSEVLSEFTNIAKPRNFAYSLGIDFIRELFSNEKYSFKGVRNKIIKRLNSNNFLKDIFFNIADKGFKF